MKLALKHRAVVVGVAVVLLAVSMVLAVSRGTEFMPEMESTQVSVTMEMPGKDITLEDTGKMADQVMDRLLTIPDVEDIGAMAGGSGMNLMGGGQSRDKVSMYLILKEDKELSNEEMAKAIEEKTKDLECILDVQTSSMDMSALGAAASP